jgi:hypothetical protein
MFKMGSHCSFWTSETQVMAKRRGRKSNCQFDSRPEKVRNRPDLLSCRQRATYLGKLSTRATTLLQIALRSEVCSQSYGAPKSRESQLVGFWDSPVGVPGVLGVPREKSHLDVGPVESCRVYYKGEGGGFPKSGPWWVLCVRVARGSS